MIVAHLDLDAFFAAVEELENPELKTKPLVVGGDPHGRGVVGRILRDRARGIDPRQLELSSERISISVENTFERDLADRRQLHAELVRMAGSVAETLTRNGQTARTVTTKLRYTDFSIRSR